MVTTYARTGYDNGVVWSIQTKKNNKITAVIKNKKEEFITWDRAEQWVHSKLREVVSKRI